MALWLSLWPATSENNQSYPVEDVGPALPGISHSQSHNKKDLPGKTKLGKILIIGVRVVRVMIPASMVTHWKTVSMARTMLSKLVIPWFGPSQFSKQTDSLALKG